ncbi:hypothetical protein [Salinibacterium sp. M195]|uniref:hypothetical protein n=1 Tax=Salinibacterium sp. M195 TaxID=2583374 RepID=UPI001C627191|nr:hypothetical protein [Salinibacterium sp. M195]QYH34556.1 hypothetical protein FFT87_00505 [Salinibacterium sp. M195]
MDELQGVVGVTGQATNVVRTLRAALLLIAALLTVVALVTMHSVAADASTASAATAHATIHTDAVPHDSDEPSAELCPCPGDSGSSMTECTPVAALAGLVAVASLRAESAGFAPTAPVTSGHAGALGHTPTPSLHALSISRT